jgi:hypothetical protein
MRASSGALRYLWPAAVWLALTACRADAPRDQVPQATVSSVPYTADGRRSSSELFVRFDTLSSVHGWQTDTIYSYPGEDDLVIRAWRTAQRGAALWILAGIHGEEPAGPNAIAARLDSIVELAALGVPMVVIPLCNPKGYRNNWRYPNTPDRDWRGGGYSVGDSEYLLPDLQDGSRPRAPRPSGPETEALTQFALRLAAAYPPRLVLDLHEDELSAEGGYVYTQGSRPSPDPVAGEIVRVLQAAGMPLRMSGQTRFGETILNGVIDGDGKGQPIHDGSIDELLIAPWVFRDGVKTPGPGAPNSIVVETPAFAGSGLKLRVAAQSAVLNDLQKLWSLNASID